MQESPINIITIGSKVIIYASGAYIVESAFSTSDECPFGVSC